MCRWATAVGLVVILTTLAIVVGHLMERRTHVVKRWRRETQLDRIERKLDIMARTVDEALSGLVDVAVTAIGQLKAAKQEIQDLKDSDAADDAAQIQATLDSVADRIDAATAGLTAPAEVPVEPTEPPAEIPPVEETPPSE